jgi:hypothetical protein
MPGFFHTPQRILKFGLALFVLALFGELAQAVGRCIGVPLGVVLILVGIVAVVLTVKETLSLLLRVKPTADMPRQGTQPSKGKKRSK